MRSLPKDVARCLDAAVRRVRLILFTRGLMDVCVVFLAVTLLAMAVDAAYPIFREDVRWGISVAIYAVVLVTVLHAVVRPFREPISRRRMAHALDARHPEYEELLSTVVELAERKEGEDALFRYLVKSAERVAGKVNPRREFTFRSLKWRFAALLFLLALAVGWSTWMPSMARILAVRALAPWEDVGSLRADQIEVVPGDVIALVGTDIGISARVKGDLAGRLMLRVSRRTEKDWSREYAQTLEGGVFRTVADAADPLWRYRVSCGPTVTRHFTVRVCEPPELESFHARLDYPAYTGWSPRIYTNEEVVAMRVLAGTRLTFDARPKTTNDIVRFAIVPDDPARGNEMLRAEGGRWAVPLPPFAASDGAAWRTNMLARWSLRLVSSDGFESAPREGVLETVPDLPPNVRIDEPVQALHLSPHGSFPLVYSCSDDVGVRRIDVRRRIDGGPFEIHRSIVPETPEASREREVEDVMLARLDLGKAKRVEFDVVVTDGRPDEFGGAQSATSTPVVVRLEDWARSFDEQTIRDRVRETDRALQESADLLHRAENEVREAKWRFENALWKGKDVAEEAERRVENAQQKSEAAENRLRELVESLRRDGRFEPIAQAIENARTEKVRPGSEELATTQEAALEEKPKHAETAANLIKESIQTLRDLRQPLHERAQELEQLERAEDLVARQQLLAEMAAEFFEPEKSGAEENSDGTGLRDEVTGRDLERLRRGEDTAAQRARELNDRMHDDQLEAARRQMEMAAQMMGEARRRADVRSARHLTPEQRARQYAHLDAEFARRFSLESQASTRVSVGKQISLQITSAQTALESVASAQAEKLGVARARTTRQPSTSRDWFRVRGTLKEGGGLYDLERVPQEYRDLVRRYFLKLSNP